MNLKHPPEYYEKEGRDIGREEAAERRRMRSAMRSKNTGAGVFASRDKRAPQTETQKKPTRPRLVVRRALEEIKLPPPREIVEGIAAADRITVLVSPSGEGKTFVLADLAAAVADDAPWMDRAVHGGSVLYVSYEGDALGLRFKALQQYVGRRLEHVYIIHATDPLSPRVTRDGEEPSIGEIVLSEASRALATDLDAHGRPPIVLLIIDTVRASMTGSEDSSEHTSGYLRAVRRVARVLPGASVMLSHHAGWQDGENARKRERGSSAWRGNCDVTLYLEAGDYDATRGEAPLTLQALKFRDREPLPPLHLVRRRVELDETDAQGRRRTSCVIAPDDRTPEDRAAAVKTALEAAERVIDLRVLRQIHDSPATATSQARISKAIGARKGDVGDAIARLVDRRCLVMGPKRQPYVLTPAGLQVVEGADGEPFPNGSQRFPEPLSGNGSRFPP